MAYTKKQRVFAEYMLRKVGINNEGFIDAYLSHLEFMYGKMILYMDTKWVYSTGDCIQMLMDEINLKKSVNSIKSASALNRLIWATDLANYSFCPISYVLSKSFEIEKPSGIEFTEIGKKLHEKLILLNKIQPKKLSEDEFPPEEKIPVDSFRSPLIEKIKNSKLIYSGHSENKVFMNEQEEFSGSPDYIFQDENGHYFAVEEKFHRRKDPYRETYEEMVYMQDNFADQQREIWRNTKISFFKNHQVQLISYLNNIKEYDLKYGYLIYWYYDFEYGEPYVHREAVSEIKLDEQKKAYYHDIKNGITELVKSKSAFFDKSILNPRKCAGCVVNKYCAHKSGNFDQIKFPYDRWDLTLANIPFPEELKKPPSDNTPGQ